MNFYMQSFDGETGQSVYKQSDDTRELNTDELLFINRFFLLELYCFKNEEKQVQFVFWDNNTHSTFEDALALPDGLAILANLFYEKDLKEKPKAFTMLQNMVERGQLNIGGKVTMLDNIEDFLIDLLPNGSSQGPRFDFIINLDFYTYSGSLTTYDCTDRVTWFVMKDPKPAEISMLRKISSSENHPEGKYKGRMCDNFRELQFHPRYMVFW
ncbi:carbonic anhydrase 6 [Hydra vulgaris]|uniref:carbonic anhydrase 6 n=1 Tax=Hydra vulgaris TaxID=6087 RepID=UPI001F5EF98F|nr:carbonic anhydrase 6-like [Hydra vulgaris]